VELWNTGNLAIADEIFSSNFVNHDPSNPTLTDLKSYKGHVLEARAAFPDFHLEVHDMVAEGDKVAARWTHTGTYTPTGKQITVTGMVILRFAGGKIVEAWWISDALGVLQQLGVIPPTREDYTWGEPSEVTGAPGDL
jgi:predicted ester cyclase